MQSERVVFFNGVLVPEYEARISIYDSALMFGDMVFEMTRSFKGIQFKLKEHLERLYTSIKYTHIPLAMPLEGMEEAVYFTIEANRSAFAYNDEHRVMINVSRGLLSIYQDKIPVDHGPNVTIADFPLRWTVAGMGRLFDEGINAVIPSQRAIPASLLEPKVKSRSRLHLQMANIEVSRLPGKNNWALLCDPDGFIAEGTGDNFFIVKDNVVFTPEPRNILRGVSRAYIINMAPALGYECIEKNIGPYDVLTADEAFMTGTPFCMLPVTSLNGMMIGMGAPGPVYRNLLDNWGHKVGVDIEGQIKLWNEEDGEKTSGGSSPYSFEE